MQHNEWFTGSNDSVLVHYRKNKICFQYLFVNIYRTQNLPFCHIFLTLKCKGINPQSFSSEVLMILRGKEFLVVEKKKSKELVQVYSLYQSVCSVNSVP